jgi:hypothetical protein
MEGSFLLEPPPAVRHSRLLDDRDFELDRWLRWKPPDLEESRQSADVVRLRDNGMSSSYSPGPEAPRLPPAFGPTTLPVPTGYSLAETELVPPAQQRLVPPVVVGRSSEFFPTCCHVLSGPKPDRRLHWKPPKLKGSRCCIIYIIRPGSSRMGRIGSPGVKTAPMPFKPLPELRPQLSGLEPQLA